MDAVQVFNDELQSLLDIKPPVSKAKMGLITRAAMKGVKFYKYIVQSVEKFIGRCRPEYKVPGLYVIDSIVRQSRHQYGVERDVFAARFSRNFQLTFSNLFAGCLADDKPKIVRVLNLWQKNGVFNAQIIQPLLDMANPNSSLNLPTESTLSADSPLLDIGKSSASSKYSRLHSSNLTSNGPRLRGVDNLAASPVQFSQNMLDFDYGEDDDGGDETPTEAEPPLSSTLNKIELEQHRNLLPHHLDKQTSQLTNTSSKCSRQNMSGSSETSLQRSSIQDAVLERWNKLMRNQSVVDDSSNDNSVHESRSSRPRSRSRSPVSRSRNNNKSIDRDPSQEKPPETPKEATPPIQTPPQDVAERRAEREAERKRKCLPQIRDKHLTVCSSTLWLGHVPKTVSEADISDAFGEFGTINSIDLIPPRGCAYVCMDRRQDAKRALSESKDLKLNNSHIKMAWAPGKGFKEYKNLKDFWEVDTGCSYIPYNKVDSSIDFDTLEEGGVVDEDSMSMEMREMRERKQREKEEKAREPQAQAPPPQPVTSMAMPLPTLPIMAQPPPFALPPPNLAVPPPTALTGMSGIPFPPPRWDEAPPVSQSSSVQLDLQKQDGSIGLLDETNVPKSPKSIDQQLSMTEQQISAVAQQLNMIQQRNQSQNIHPVGVHPQASTMFLNPMMFDLTAGPLLGRPPMLTAQQLAMLGPQTSAPLLPISQANLNPNMSGNSMPPYNGHF